MQHSLKRRRWLVVGVAMAALQTGCSAWRLADVPDPSVIVDPSVVETEAGAIALYRNAISTFNSVFAGGNAFSGSGSFVAASGTGSDEMYVRNTPFALRAVGYDGLPVGETAAGEEEPWYSMHRARLQIDQSIGALKKYGKPTTPSSYLAQLYALRGFNSVMFAELFCSGTPFSRAIYGGDIVFGQPLTTEQVLEQAIADFDSALAITTDSVRIRQMATIGKARALVNLNRISDAATLVSGIPTAYRYDAQFSQTSGQNYTVDGSLRMMDRLGVNGLDYLSAGQSGDFRVATVMSSAFQPIAAKFGTGAASIPLADGLEARLIEAEAKLRAEDFDGWADILNALRQSAGSQTLHALSVDSTSNADQQLRESVMFRERAFWLYGTGRRFGDMRRLVRQYKRSLYQVFPRGQHPHLPYDPNIISSKPSFAPPTTELNNNPNFKGCFNRDA